MTNKWVRAEKGKAYQVVVQKVMDKIVKGVLKPGNRLASERELADNLGVCRSSVREGLKTMEYLGLLEVVEGQGALIKEVEPQVVAEIWALILLQEKAKFLHVIEARKIVECNAAEIAAIRRTPEDLFKLESCLSRMLIFSEEMSEQMSEQKTKEFINLDKAFHKYIACATQNPMIVQLYDPLSIISYKHMEIKRQKIRSSKIIYEGHQLIYDAIKNQDEKKARDEMRKHLSKFDEFNDEDYRIIADEYDISKIYNHNFPI